MFQTIDTQTISFFAKITSNKYFLMFGSYNHRVLSHRLIGELQKSETKRIKFRGICAAQWKQIIYAMWLIVLARHRPVLRLHPVSPQKRFEWNGTVHSKSRISVFPWIDALNFNATFRRKIIRVELYETNAFRILEEEKTKACTSERNDETNIYETRFESFRKINFQIMKFYVKIYFNLLRLTSIASIVNCQYRSLRANKLKTTDFRAINNTFNMYLHLNRDKT